ncbi:MAG: hypothetical protein QHH00_05700 [Methanomassiliicoccales archaeon]|jgi:hypothetical protein|nr:hypothetical protein [Methanomassiliicoccales archaeon]
MIYNQDCEEVVVDVDPGVCRFNTEIRARLHDERIVLAIKSDCPAVESLGKCIGEIDPIVALAMPFSRNPIYLKAGEILKHSTCPVPMAILKCIEVAAGLALRRDVIVKFRT